MNWTEKLVFSQIISGILWIICAVKPIWVSTDLFYLCCYLIYWISLYYCVLFFPVYFIYQRTQSPWQILFHAKKVRVEWEKSMREYICNSDKKCFCRVVNYLMMSQSYFANPWVVATQTNPILMLSFIQRTARLDVAQWHTYYVARKLWYIHWIEVK